MGGGGGGGEGVSLLLVFCESVYLCLIFWFKNRDQGPKIELCIKLQPNWTKDEGALISISVSGGGGWETGKRS